MNKKQHFFVYGTLAPGRPNEHVLADIEGDWAPAKIRGTLFAEGWGNEHGYPGLKRLADSGWVDGLLFSSFELDKKWQELDELEGDDYVRVETDVILNDSNQTIKAQVYILNE